MSITDNLKSFGNSVADFVTSAKSVFEKTHNCEKVLCFNISNLNECEELKASIDRQTYTIFFSCALSICAPKNGRLIFVDSSGKIMELKPGTITEEDTQIQMNTKIELLKTTRASFDYKNIDLR